MPKAEIYRSKSFWADIHQAQNPLDEGVFGGEEPLVTFVPGRIAPIIHVRNGNKVYPSSDARITQPFTRFYPPILTPSSVHAERATVADAALLARLTQLKAQREAKQDSRSTDQRVDSRKMAVVNKALTHAKPTSSPILKPVAGSSKEFSLSSENEKHVYSWGKTVGNVGQWHAGSAQAARQCEHGSGTSPHGTEPVESQKPVPQARLVVPGRVPQAGLMVRGGESQGLGQPGEPHWRQEEGVTGKGINYRKYECALRKRE
ncbi:hypothetical protein C8J57DRAFT_1214142 [Mycena rebaudengoi]|nr:hypothetical protein C8J57DRAFT_1214142 [Mycena rebaudengoi]